MELLSTHHQLLRLVDANKNTLKCALVKYIDVTVEQQFGQLRDRIVHMIESGEIVHVNASDQQLTSNIFSSLVNTVTTELILIKQECPDTSSSSTIPINVHCNDAPNGDDDNQSVHVGIEVNQSKNAQVPIDDVKEEYDYDDDDVDEEEGEYMFDCAGCEDCGNGICGLVGENDDAHNDAHTGVVDMLSGLGEGEIEDELNDSLESDLMIISNVIDPSNQSTNNANDLSLINESEQQIRSNQNATMQNGQSVQPIVENNQQSIPSTSGLRSSCRNRIQTKLFGVVQSNGQVKSEKRKCKSNSRKAVKKVRMPNIEEIHQDEKEAKFQVVTLKVNCTEADCQTKFLNSFKMWKQHLSSTHDQLPYQHLHDNVRHNQHGQTEYPCTECEAVCNSQDSLILHWKMYHLSGKFKCSICGFVGNLWCEVRNHYRTNHLRKTIQCTQEGCNQTFQFMNNLEIHQRIHTGERPYRCTWHNCEVSFNQIGTAIQHVRLKHFRLPRTVREQKELNIIDERDPKMYVQLSRG